MLKNGIKEIKIKNYDELVNLIRGKDKRTNHDLREDYIFRGLSNVEYKLIPSSLRRNNLNQLNINEFIEPNHKFKVSINKKEAEDNNLNFTKQYYDDDNVIVFFDKNGVPIYNKHSKYRAPENKLQIERELYILMKFLNFADKSGLKVNAEGFSRYLLHYKNKEPLDEFMSSEIIELISLAQHYGLPTKALDWSYDYKVSLYFAVKDILITSKSNDGSLWALNYKLVENRESNDDNYHVNLLIHRPEYNTNPNLNAQKGVFTYLERYVENYDKPLDELISSELNQKLEDRPVSSYYDSKTTTIPTNITKDDTIFYKFIIPKEIKHEILNELYLEGYSEENLFPGYSGVVQAINNRLELDEYIKKLNTPPKINMIMSFDENEIENIFESEKRIIFKQKVYHSFLDNIFIYSKDSGEILGYFKGNEIIKNTPENMWNTFHEKSILSEEEFLKYFENKNEVYGIKINNLTKLDYPIKISLNMESEFYYIHPNDKNLNYLLNFIK